ncbi:chitooligosaccharidolytic beta-N-acetylglucosaminidase-like isoform X2 [Rhopalosiphum padi]|nr:chitooligosaccharidolytic beta-N-acetylglucosaminidase-like isoform X2 [Rhopalosiphum padi]XP_060834732.1 chitooligosaccharidolytic beta-N-acetylglucosaminidase-like isoform X2 [Rhopalosiphum padi]XP_060834733.1 chitooligosaccharidolytic beta-N-acetylglucosaminidase-like isoform X2 [Rhopalosiphum padi]
MAGCVLMASVMLLYLIAVMRQNAYVAAEDDSDTTKQLYFVKSFKCINNTCIVSKLSSMEKENSGVDGSVDVCRLTCGRYGSLWPKPTVNTTIRHSVIEFGLDNVKFDTSKMADQLSKEYMSEASQVFILSLKKLCVPNCVSYTNTPIISISTSNLFDHIKLTTDESYSLKINIEGNSILINIEAKTVYGARNGLETVRQLVATYGSSESGKKLVMAGDVQITDRPIYAYRGFMLDTARHYFPISTIKRHIDAMAHSKLNVFHWHATDSHSFPLDLPSAPLMSKYGAYSPNEKYSFNEIKDLLRYALVRGVRIIIEIDSPAHAGNGWQWGKEFGFGDMAVCVDRGPWNNYCVQPPCGQLNPINTNTYKWLGKIYKDLINVLPKGEAFHMGGDEVALNCWNTTIEITDWMKNNNRSLDEEGYLGLWSQFHANSLSEYDKESGDDKSDIIVWSSGLTEPKVIERYLDKRRYTVEVWEGSNSPEELVKLGYKVIMALQSVYYLDHGFWFSTNYHTWEEMYNNKMPNVDDPNLLLGAETCMWSEYVDDNAIDSKVWPRAAALAERLWSNPTSNSVSAGNRFLQHRERLITLGVKADTVTPEWCYIHEGECILE